MAAALIQSIAISIIVPVFNVEKYLHDCIDSILDQNINLEIILINDGSTDQSGKIIDAYHKTNQNIKVIHQENQGLSATRNKGIQIASGEYIVFVDSDDWLAKNSLAVLYNTAKKNDVDIIMGNVLSHNPNEEIDISFGKINESKHNIIFSGEQGFIELMKTGTCPPMVFNYIYKREWLIRHDFQFHDLLHEDELWTPIALCHAKRMLVVNHDFYHYRQREGSIMQTLNPEKRIASLFIICNRLIRFTNSTYKGNSELFSWLYVKIFQLYRVAFSTLFKLRKSTYMLPSHHLYSIFRIYHRLEKIPRQICRQNYLLAKKELKKYLRLRLSPWFNVRYEPGMDKTLILIYNTMWDEPFPLRPEDVPLDCLITTDRHYLLEADAIVFHIPTLHYELVDDLDKLKGQIWIAWSLECEENYPIWKSNKFMSLFDMRMSYHQYADIIYPYYKYDDLKSIYKSTFSSDKINKCCMLISNQFSQSNREEFIEELMKYTDIDSYGKLFNNSEIINDKGRETKLDLYSKYKFVIAFENSIGRDYVTEKFFDPLLVGTVPIYLGAPNIDEYAPDKNSFIDIRLFENPHQLADFINQCYHNPELYSQFHSWKNKPFLNIFTEKVKKQKINPFLALCNKVKEKKKEIIKNEEDIISLGNISLCAFADSRYAKSLERLRLQADDMELFKDVYIYNELDLDESFRSFFSNQLNKGVCGFGYWVWKPYLIYQSLLKINENDVLLYIDVGCHLNYKGEKCFIDYWKTVKNNKTGFLVSQLEADKLERKWTKGDVLDYFDVRNNPEITDTPQYQAGIIFIRKNRHTVNVIKEWLSIFYSNFHLADDSPSLSINMDGYIDHRHDQSILSILLKKYGTSIIPVEEIYTSNEWEFLEKHAPILVKRDLR